MNLKAIKPNTVSRVDYDIKLQFHDLPPSSKCYRVKGLGDPEIEDSHARTVFEWVQRAIKIMVTRGNEYIVSLPLLLDCAENIPERTLFELRGTDIKCWLRPHTPQQNHPDGRIVVVQYKEILTRKSDLNPYVFLKKELLERAESEFDLMPKINEL